MDFLSGREPFLATHLNDEDLRVIRIPVIHIGEPSGHSLRRQNGARAARKEARN